MEGAISIFTILLLNGARFLPVVTLTPLYGGTYVPMPVRIGTACVLGVLSTPELALTGGSPEIGAFAAEIFTGFMLAMPVFFVLKLLPAAGACLDQVCGTGAVELLFPTGSDRGAPAEQVASMTVVAASLAAGLHLEMADLIMDSRQIIELGTWMRLTDGGLAALLGGISGALASGVSFGLPFLVIGIGVEVAFNAAGKVAPGVVFSELSMPVKNIAATVIMCLAIGPMYEMFSGWTRDISGMVFGMMG